VLDVLMATIVLHYPAIIRLQADESVGFVARVRQCLDFCDVPESEFLSWHGFLYARVNAPITESEPHEPKQRSTVAVPEQTSSRLEAMLAQLLEQNREQGERILRLEKLLGTILQSADLHTLAQATLHDAEIRKLGWIYLKSIRRPS
jgi:hypothetical protein